MNQNKLTNQFKKTQNLSYNRRKLEMTRTILAQTNHQQNFLVRTNPNFAAEIPMKVNTSQQSVQQLYGTQKLAQTSTNRGKKITQSQEVNKFGLRIGKKRPMTTRKDVPRRLNQSGVFQFNKGRDRSGNSDETGRLTSAVTIGAPQQLNARNKMTSETTLAENQEN